MSKGLNEFKDALEGKHYSLVILDNKYHRLVKRVGKSKDMEAAEKELSDLVKRQGQLNNDIKAVKRIKSKLMQEIVDNMEQSKSKVEENRRLIDEANERIVQYEDELIDLPRQIDTINKELLVMLMERCYGILDKYTDDIEAIAIWIERVREELKENVVKKQDMEITNVEIYTFMHDILGPEVIETFDIRYDIEARRQAILDKQRAKKEQQELMNQNNKSMK